LNPYGHNPRCTFLDSAEKWGCTLLKCFHASLHIRIELHLSYEGNDIGMFKILWRKSFEKLSILVFGMFKILWRKSFEKLSILVFGMFKILWRKSFEKLSIRTFSSGIWDVKGFDIKRERERGWGRKKKRRREGESNTKI
jgi:hypothetical protein